MNNALKLLLAGLTGFALVMGCGKKGDDNKGDDNIALTDGGAQLIAPESAGERGTSCEAKNDCGDNLSCIAGICQPANFDIDSTVKECFRVECAETADCCGTKELVAPPKCREQAIKCVPFLAGCNAGSTCMGDSQCGGGSCDGGFRRCSADFNVCSDAVPCDQDTCVPFGGLGGMGPGTCALSGLSCTSNTDCTRENTCGPGSCECNNPDYDPFDAICSDEDCENICTKVCEDELCVEDNSCESDAECVAGNRNTCVDGDCVECTTNAECDDEFDDEDDLDECREGTCVSPCIGDAECGMFQECQEGECAFVGCKTDRECVLAGGIAGPGDPRLAKCVQEKGIGMCKIECEIDAHCSLDETCQDGACKYIGCDSDDECKTILGLHNWNVTTDIPYVPSGECREVVAE